MPRAQFLNEIKELGYEFTDLADGKIWFPYRIPVGKFAGREIKLGFVVGDDYNLNPPGGGPHISPRLLPLNPVAGAHPVAGIHPSPFGDEWEYWSRPLKHWTETTKTAKEVMRHIKHLFDTQ